jgi:hypothetical protein
MADVLPGHAAARRVVQFAIDLGGKLLQGALVALPPRLQKLRNFVSGRFGHRTASNRGQYLN